jgi:hypothetical protein
MDDQRSPAERYWDTGPAVAGFGGGAAAPALGAPPSGAPAFGPPAPGDPLAGAAPGAPAGGAPYAGPPPGAVFGPPQHRAGPPPGAAPSGPPARTGSAAVGLACAVATLLIPAFFLLIGFPLLGLLVNVPGIAFGVVALTRTADPPEVERFIRYMWAGTMLYLALVAVVFAAVIVLLMATMPPF